MRKIAVALLAVAMLLASAPARGGGNTARYNDANDTTGRFDVLFVEVSVFDLLDIKKIELMNKVEFPVRISYFGGDNLFTWSLDTSGSDEIDFSVYLDARSREGRLRMRCLVYEETESPSLIGKKRGFIDGRRGSCLIPANMVGGLPEHFNTGTYFNGNSDFAPDDFGTFPFPD